MTSTYIINFNYENLKMFTQFATTTKRFEATMFIAANAFVRANEQRDYHNDSVAFSKRSWEHKESIS